MEKQRSRRTNIWATGGGIYSGFNAKGQMKLYTGERGIITIAPSGSGKTRRSLLVTAARLAGKWSMVITDLKGELTAMLAPHFEEAGSEVIIFDPFGTSSRGFNNVQNMKLDDDFIDNLMADAEALIKKTANEQQPHFPEGMQEVMAGLQGFVRLVIPNGSLEDVRTFINYSIEQFQELILAEEIIYKGARYPGVLKAANHMGRPEIAGKLNRFSNISPDNRELLGILGTGNVQTRWLDSRPIKRELKGPTFDFSVMKDRPVVVFINLPPKRLRTHATWMRLVITSIVQALMSDVKTAKVPCLLAIDEFFAVADGGFDIITKNVGLFRGYGIKLWTIWQDLSQAQKLLGVDYFESFFANAGLVQALATQDCVTSEYLSRRAGQQTRPSLSLTGGRSRTLGAMPNLSESSSVNQVAAPLLLPQEIRCLPEGDALTFSHQLESGQGIYHLPYPTELDFMREIMKRDPAA